MMTTSAAAAAAAAAATASASVSSSVIVPVITILSSSRRAAYRAINVLSQWTSLQSLESNAGSSSTTASLHHFHCVIPWTQVTTTACPESGVLIQWLAPDRGSSDTEIDQQDSSSSSSWPTTNTGTHSHSLLAIQTVALPPLILDNHRLNTTTICSSSSALPVIQALLDQRSSTLLSRGKLKWAHWLRRPIRSSYLLGASERPLLQFVKNHDTHTHIQATAVTAMTPSLASPSPLPYQAQQQQLLRRHGSLKEIVIPLNDSADDHNDDFYDHDRDGWSFQLAHLARPVTGLYQIAGPPLSLNHHSHSAVCIRPVPTGTYDRQLPPPSFIFHIDRDRDHDRDGSDCRRSRSSRQVDAPPWPSFQDDGAVSLQKIGHTSCSSSSSSSSSSTDGGRGGDGGGQYRLVSSDLNGLDVRLCSSHEYRSMFAEAQESLLSGSLDKLQSSRVLHREGHHSSNKRQPPPRSDAGSDCWVEFRETLKRPSGFFQRTPLKIAKPPNLPFE